MALQKSHSAKRLLAKLKLPLDAYSFYNGLIMGGAMVIQSYLSTTGSGEEKYFMQLTETGLQFGINIPSSYHEFKTEPSFFEPQFKTAYLLAVTALMDHARQITED